MYFNPQIMVMRCQCVLPPLLHQIILMKRMQRWQLGMNSQEGSKLDSWPPRWVTINCHLGLRFTKILQSSFFLGGDHLILYLEPPIVLGVMPGHEGRSLKRYRGAIVNPQKFRYMLTLESRCILVVGEGVLC